MDQKRRADVNCKHKTSGYSLVNSGKHPQGLPGRWPGESFMEVGICHLVNLKLLLGIIFWSDKHWWGEEGTCSEGFKGAYSVYYYSNFASQFPPVLKALRHPSHSLPIQSSLRCSQAFPVSSENQPSFCMSCLSNRKRRLVPTPSHPSFLQHSTGSKLSSRHFSLEK